MTLNNIIKIKTLHDEISSLIKNPIDFCQIQYYFF